MYKSISISVGLLTFVTLSHLTQRPAPVNSQSLPGHVPRRWLDTPASTVSEKGAKRKATWNLNPILRDIQSKNNNNITTKHTKQQKQS